MILLSQHNNLIAQAKKKKTFQNFRGSVLSWSKLLYFYDAFTRTPYDYSVEILCSLKNDYTPTALWQCF